MQKVELTSKFVLAALIATVVFSAMTVPSVVAQSTSSPPIRANSVTSGSIKDGDVKTNDLANNAVTSPKIADGTIQEQDIADGVIPSGNTQPNVHIVSSHSVLGPGEFGDLRAECADGETISGGGFDAIPISGPLRVYHSQADTDHSWKISAINDGQVEQDIFAQAVCYDFSP